MNTLLSKSFLIWVFSLIQIFTYSNDFSPTLSPTYRNELQSPVNIALEHFNTSKLIILLIQLDPLTGIQIYLLTYHTALPI